jgi:hypothetical protein
MYYPSNNQNHQKFTFSPNWKSPHKKACRPTKRTNTDGIPFTPKNPSQPLRRETNTTCTLTTTRATTTIANRASASTPFATRGTSVRSRAFSSHFFYLTFFFCSVCDAALFSFYSLSLSLSLFRARARGIPRFFLCLTRAIFSRFFFESNDRAVSRATANLHGGQL